MRLISNASLIKRNAAIGRYASLAGLVVLVGGLVFSIVVPPGQRPELQFIPLVTLLFGFLLSNLGIFYSNRWVRPPRPDEALDASLKGLDDRHVLYHYRLPASHVLVAPSGVYVLLPKRQGGTVSFADGKWRHSGHNRFLAFFGQEGLGNPLAELAGEVSALNKYFEKNLPEAGVPLKGIVVFTNTATSVDADDAPVPVLHTKKLKDYIRRQPKGATLSQTALGELNKLLKLNGDAAA
jgi:hypothetical protein